MHGCGVHYKLETPWTQSLPKINANPTTVLDLITFHIYMQINVVGKPSINASFAGCSNDSVTMQWKQDTDNEYNYVLSATPPVENCDPNCTVQSTTKYEFTGLERGKMYNLTVQASNCVGSTEERKTVYIPSESLNSYFHIP